MKHELTNKSDMLKKEQDSNNDLQTQLIRISNTTMIHNNEPDVRLINELTRNDGIIQYDELVGLKQRCLMYENKIKEITTDRVEKDRKIQELHYEVEKYRTNCMEYEIYNEGLNMNTIKDIENKEKEIKIE